MKLLFADTETFSTTDLKTCGTHAYFEDPNAEIMVLQWALDDGEISVEDLTGKRAPSQAFLDLAAQPDVFIVAHFSHFDRTGMRHVWGLDIPVERWIDCGVQALAHGLPGALEKAGEAMGLPGDELKDKRGKRLIQLFCKLNGSKRNTRDSHPAEWAEFLSYSRTDIVSMRALFRKLPNWNYRPGMFEHQLWCLDQKLNDRGFCVDVELARAAMTVSNSAQVDLADEVSDMTAGEVGRATQRDVLLKHILEWYGVTLPDLKKDTLKRRMEDAELPQAVRELLGVRLEASMTSSSKYKALLNAVSKDGRLRNTLQFSGAQRTGRWAGRIFQPQNLRRPTMKAEEIEQGIELIKAGCPEILFPNVMTLTGNAVRGCIVAPPGKKLVVADLSNIEGRGLVYLSGEQWKLRAFAEFDAGRGPDTYKLAYARSFGIDPKGVDGDQRQIGKVQELGLGYGGGVAAFITFAAVYNMDLGKLADAVWAGASAHAITDATGMWNWAEKKHRTLGLPRHVYVACEVLKRAWRDAHPCTEALWGQADAAFRDATRNPGVTFDAGPLRFRRDGAWLRLRLPSGRYLCYLQPKVSDSGESSYMGISQYSRQWSRLKTYGGKLVENATQAWARDVLAASMEKVEAAGYPIVLSCHDELLTEVPDDETHDHETLSRIMSEPPSWAPDVPLAAAGFSAYRYRK